MLGKLLNSLVEQAADSWFKSDKARRYAASAVLRGGQVLMGILLAKWGAKYGVDGATQALITGHWQAILELAAPAVGAAVIELASNARAALNAKALQVAVAAPAHSLTPQDAQDIAKKKIEG